MSRIIIEHTGKHRTKRGGITGAEIVGKGVQNLLLAYTTVFYELKQTRIIAVIDKNEQTTIGRNRNRSSPYLGNINISKWCQTVLGHHINDKRTDSSVPSLQSRIIGTTPRRHIVAARHSQEQREIEQKNSYRRTHYQCFVNLNLSPRYRTVFSPPSTSLFFTFCSFFSSFERLSEK